MTSDAWSSGRWPNGTRQSAPAAGGSTRAGSGCQRNRLPREFPDDSSVHRTFQRRVRLGVLDRIWAMLLESCEDLDGCDWEWQAADGWLGKARMGGTWWGPTPQIAARTG